ncbi:MAG: hypothetical protein R2738_00300 [Bacteroides graminisolvens]
MAACSDYSALAAKITDLKTEGELKNTVAMPRSTLHKYYLTIYNTAGKIVAILARSESHQYQYQNPDSEKNYSGCGAIGFKVK